MTVVHLIDSEGMFGAEYMIFNLLPALQELGVNPVMGCLSPINSAGSDLGRALEKRNIGVIYIDEQWKISLRGLSAIYRILKTTHANILHVHGYKATILGGIIASLFKIPLFSTYHAEAKQCPQLSTYVRIETLFLRNASRIVAVSRKIKEELLSRGIRNDKISVIYNGIEDPVDVPVDFERFHSNKKSINALCIGRLIPIKRFDLVIDAIYYLHKDYPNISLSIAGVGPMEESLKTKVKQYGLDHSIKILGYIEDTKYLYQDSDIFVLFSNTEGSPIVLIEAMAHSLPIISTTVGAIPEMINNATEALLISPCNVSQLIDSLRMLITQSELRMSLGKAARMKYEEKFTSKAMANSYLEQYKLCLKGT